MLVSIDRRVPHTEEADHLGGSPLLQEHGCRGPLLPVSPLNSCRLAGFVERQARVCGCCCGTPPGFRADAAGAAAGPDSRPERPGEDRESDLFLSRPPTPANGGSVAEHDHSAAHKSAGRPLFSPWPSAAISPCSVALTGSSSRLRRVRACDWPRTWFQRSNMRVARERPLLVIIGALSLHPHFRKCATPTTQPHRDAGKRAAGGVTAPSIMLGQVRDA